MSASTTDQLLRAKGFVVAIGAAAGGLVVGVVLSVAGALDLVGESASVAGPAEAPVFECPSEGSAGVMLRGDRVYATGRDATGEWIEVRGRDDGNARVWIRAAHLTPDADLTALPVIPCHESVVAVVETTSVDTTTTTTPATTTTTQAQGTTTTTVATTTTTLPAAPSVGSISEQHDPIWERLLPYTDSCLGSANTPVTSSISAPITAPAGVDAVVMLWSVGSNSGQKTMSLSGGESRATLGPFDGEDPNIVAQNQSLPITVTIRVTDDLGRTAQRSTTVTLMDCTFG